jgi:exonuclease VII large subunit
MADALVQGNQTEQAILHALDALEQLDLEIVIIIREEAVRLILFIWTMKL